jgi:hypothetical protein
MSRVARRDFVLPKPRLKDPAFVGYQIKPTITPRRIPSCSGVVYVENGHERGFSNIYFSDRFVERLGELMMYGVSSSFPVYLHSIYKKGVDHWYTYCTYFSSAERTLLWVTEEYPPWFGKIYKPKPIK